MKIYIPFTFNCSYHQSSSRSTRSSKPEGWSLAFAALRWSLSCSRWSRSPGRRSSGSCWSLSCPPCSLSYEGCSLSHRLQQILTRGFYGLGEAAPGGRVEMLEGRFVELPKFKSSQKSPLHIFHLYFATNQDTGPRGGVEMIEGGFLELPKVKSCQKSKVTKSRQKSCIFYHPSLPPINKTWWVVADESCFSARNGQWCIADAGTGQMCVRWIIDVKMQNAKWTMMHYVWPWCIADRCVLRESLMWLTIIKVLSYSQITM